MSKHFYLFAIAIVLLQILSGSSQSIFFRYDGTEMFQREGYAPWFLFSNAVSLVLMVVLCSYYLAKRYWVAFSCLIVFALASCWYSVSFYKVTQNEPADLLQYASIVAMITAEAYYASLIFSQARRNVWLRLTGFAGFVLHSALIYTYAIVSSGPSFHTLSNMMKLQQMILICLNLLPILLIVNFSSEVTVARTPDVSNRYAKGYKISFLLVTGLLCSSGVAFFTNLTFSSYDKPLYGGAFIKYAQDVAAPFTPFTFVNNRGDTSRYRLLTPINYNSTIKYPLLLCLHHAGGGTDNVMQVQAAEIAPLFVDSAVRIKYPCFVLVPQCSPGATWGGLPNTRSDEEVAFSAIEDVQRNYSIDKARIYVTGASMGGFGTWNFIYRRPSLFAAAIPICSGADPLIAKRIASIPLWVFHGKNDSNVPVRYSRDMIKSLRHYGGNPRYTEVAEGTHNIGSLVQQTPGLLDWLFAQKK